METTITMVLILVLTVSGLGALIFLNGMSRRTSDFAEVTAVVQQQLEAIRALPYRPPEAPFTASAVVVSNATSIFLNKDGEVFLVPGSVVARIEPVACGHLVTVTGEFDTPMRPTVVQMQTLVNKFSGGQQ